MGESEPAVNSRERLLEAAIAAIEANGEAALRVDDIARTAGVAKPSLYHFFKSREGIIAAAQAERYRRSLLVGIDGVIEFMRTSPTREEFQALVRAWLASFSTEEARHRRAVRLEVLGSSVSRPALREAVEQATAAVTAQLAEIYDEARARGLGFDTPDFESTDIAMWMNGLWNGRYLVDIGNDPERMAAWDRISLHVMESLLLDEG